MNAGLEFVKGDAASLDDVQALWSRVREYLSSRSTYFGEEMKDLTWEQRKAEILGKGDGTKVMVDLVLDAGSRSKIAYCISTVSDGGIGEVDSIFVEEGHRDRGIGDELMRRAMDWFEGEGVSKVLLVVTYGNEKVLPFYERHSFYPRRLILERKHGNGTDRP